MAVLFPLVVMAVQMARTERLAILVQLVRKLKSQTLKELKT